jgi:hypothetical protein
VRLAVATALALGLASPALARADVGIDPVTKIVPVGGVVQGHGNGSGMAVYLVAAAAGPRRHRCGSNGICEPTAKKPPGEPFVRLGRLRRTKDVYAMQTFSFRLPDTIEPGRYRMYLYCRPCGGSLIQSGRNIRGETIRVTRHPQIRSVGLSRERPRVSTIVSEPGGPIRVFRLTVPHGMDVVATGTIPHVAGVKISTRTSSCRRRGAVDVCNQGEEGCPMPPAAWRFTFARRGGGAGVVRLEFVTSG